MHGVFADYASCTRDIGTNYVVTEKTEHTWGINVPGISTAVAAVILIAAAHEYNLV